MGFDEILGRKRASLVLLHPTSLPDPPGRRYGIGELGSEAFRFLDFLTESGTLAWQVLPLGHTGFKDSPYQTFSRFAGSPHLVSIERLLDAGDLTREQHDAYCVSVERSGVAESRVDYGWLFQHKIGADAQDENAVLRLAHANFRSRPAGDARREAFADFCSRYACGEAAWLADYADFMAIKERHGHRPWHEWAEPFRDVARWRAERERVLESAPELARTIEFYRYIQFAFFEQWEAIHRYAQSKGRLLIGDAPWYVGFDSADVWARRGVFELDEAGRPMRVAGVPPDAFSATGQLWGNPLYDWTGEEAPRWWAEAIDALLDMFDVLRLDHFRAVDTYWVVPHEWAAEHGTAIEGCWELGPGASLLDTIRLRLQESGRIAPGAPLPLIAEDLGCFDPLYCSLEAYPFWVSQANRYRLTPRFAALLEAKNEALSRGIDPESGAYSTRRGVDTLLSLYGLPWMSVLQFGLEGGQFYDPESVPAGSVAYTGTHDNSTALAWYRALSQREAIEQEHQESNKESDKRESQEERKFTPLEERLRAALTGKVVETTDEIAPNRSEPTLEDEAAVHAMIEATLKTGSCLAGAPLQDLLVLGDEARMNLPGDGERQWWAWRATHAQVDYARLAATLGEWNRRYGRFA